MSKKDDTKNKPTVKKDVKPQSSETEVPLTPPEPVIPAEEERKVIPVPQANPTVTIRNRTNQVVVAVDINGNGIHILPKSTVTIDQSLVSADLHSKAKSGLLKL